VFLDYDGVLTPIVDRPEDAVISDGMRDTVRALARRCPVCVVSGRDRHYRLVAPSERARVATAVDTLLAERPEELKLTPGKMVFELPPKTPLPSPRAGSAIGRERQPRPEAPATR
jgi:trehalose-6-phosphatase